MGLSSNVFTEKKEQFFRFTKNAFQEEYLVFCTSLNCFSLKSPNLFFLRKLKSQFNQYLQTKSFYVNLSLFEQPSSHNRFMTELSSEYLQLRNSSKMRDISSILHNKDKQFKAKDALLEFLKNKHNPEESLERSELNYNPEKNLSKLLNKSQMNKSVNTQFNIQREQKLENYFLQLCPSKSQREQFIKLKSQYDFSPDSFGSFLLK
jgi:hypothetical protein